ncbi:hypothetical protein KI387_023741, partial [Taxus chinensis]
MTMISTGEWSLEGELDGLDEYFVEYVGIIDKGGAKVRGYVRGLDSEDLRDVDEGVIE